jgi:hypothetical protein
MGEGTRRERVIGVLRVSSRALDDDEVAARAGISPRQSVNQVCRELERSGLVRRQPGPDGKIVNAWIATTVYPRPRLILCLSDPAAAAPFLPGARSWSARAIGDFGIAVRLVTLPEDVRQRVLAAQHRQFR